MITHKTKKAKATTATAASRRGGCANDSDNRYPLANPRLPQKGKGYWKGMPKGDKGTKAKGNGKKGTKAAKAKATSAEIAKEKLNREISHLVTCIANMRRCDCPGDRNHDQECKEYGREHIDYPNLKITSEQHVYMMINFIAHHRRKRTSILDLVQDERSWDLRGSLSCHD